MSDIDDDNRVALHTIESHIAGAAKVDVPFVKASGLAFGRTSRIWLKGEQFHASSNRLNRALGCVRIFGGEETEKPLHIP